MVVDSMHANPSFNLKTVDGELLQIVDSSTDGFDEAIYNPELFNTVKVLENLQHFTNTIIRFLGKGICDSGIREWVITLKILEHKDMIVFIPWASECITFTDPRSSEHPYFPCGVTGVRKLVSTVTGNLVSLVTTNGGQMRDLVKRSIWITLFSNLLPIRGAMFLKALHYIEPSPQEREINR